MTDPAVKVEEGYAAYDTGKDAGIWLKLPDGSDMVGVVWPGQSSLIVSASSCAK